MDELDFNDESHMWAQMDNEHQRAIEQAQLAGDVGYAECLEQQVAS